MPASVGLLQRKYKRLVSADGLSYKAALRQAIEDVHLAGGGTVHLPPGTFPLGGSGGGSLHVEYDAVAIEGEGRLYSTIGGSVLFGVPTEPAGVALGAANRPDLYGVLDTSAAPSPGSRIGLRTFNLATGRYHWPTFWGTPLNSGAITGGVPDFWKTQQILLIDYAYVNNGPRAGPLIDLLDAFDRPSPYTLADDGAGFLLRFDTGTPNISAVRLAYIPAASLPSGLVRLTVRVDLGAATVRAWLNRTQVAVDLAGIGAGWNPGLHFRANDYAECRLFTSIEGGVRTSSDKTGGGLRVSAGAIYADDGVGQPQRRLDNVAIDDFRQFFYYDPSTICTLFLDPVWDDPAVDPLRITCYGGPAGGDTFSRGLFLSEEHYTLSAGVVRSGNAIRGLTVTGGNARYGDGICLGVPWDFEARDVAANGGAYGCGHLNLGANFTITMRDCRFSGAEPYLGVHQIVYLYDSQFLYMGRAGCRLVGCGGAIRGAFLNEPKPYTEFAVAIQDIGDGGNVLIEGVTLDSENLPNVPQLAAVMMEASDSGGGARLMLRDSGFGLLGNDASVVLLRSRPDVHSPCVATIADVATGGTNHRSLVRFDDPNQVWTVAGRGCGDLTGTMPLAIYGPGDPGGRARFDLYGATELPTVGKWSQGTVLHFLRPDYGETYEAHVVAAGEYGTATLPRWAELKYPVPVVTPPADPAAIPGLILWLEADRLTGLADGDGIASFPDGSATHDDATQATSALRPIYKTGIANGLPVMRLSGGRRLTLATPIDSNDPITIFAVCRPNSTASMGLLGGGGDSFLYRTNAGHQELLAASVASIAIGTATVSTTAFNLLVASYSSPAYAFRRNGAADGAGSAAYTFANPITTVGSDQGADSPFDGDVAALLCYSRPAADFSPAELAGMESYLNKYNIF